MMNTNEDAVNVYACLSRKTICKAHTNGSFIEISIVHKHINMVKRNTDVHTHTHTHWLR